MPYGEADKTQEKKIPKNSVFRIPFEREITYKLMRLWLVRSKIYKLIPRFDEQAIKRLNMRV
tara:strand:- start:300 stop:485 length:186 start_codon:yes stop_codon:yes gene_type:complete